MLPDGLKSRAQWIVWREKERRDKKPTKVPYVPGTNRYAKSNDPATWRTFEEAWTSYQRGGFDGIGYAFSADDGFTGIDLDHCAGDYGVLEPWALRIVQDMNSYTEWSPSGHGVHIFVRAALPPKGRKKGNVEMYDRLRFFTVTGNWAPITPLAIESRQTALDALHARVFPPVKKKPRRPYISDSSLRLDDTALIEKAMAARNGGKFSTLWRGDFSGMYSSQSEADLALCSCLVYWTGGDADRVDSLFRRSGLYREKWDTRHYADGRTYGQATIVRALQ